MCIRKLILTCTSVEIEEEIIGEANSNDFEKFDSKDYHFLKDLHHAPRLKL